jgi:hypothetical protein
VTAVGQVLIDGGLGTGPVPALRVLRWLALVAWLLLFAATALLPRFGRLPPR